MGMVHPSLAKTFRDLLRAAIPWPLYLHGTAGVGKTRACLAFLDFVPEAWYTTVDHVITETMEKRDATTWRYLPSYQLVVIDEVGTRRKQIDIDYLTIKRLADTREDRPIIWVSNLAPQRLRSAYDDRIASRLLCGTVFELVDQDRRMARDPRQ